MRLSFLTTLLAALCGAAAHAQTLPAGSADSRYIQRIGDQYVSFAGSSANLESLAAGLRHGSSVTLTEGTTSIAFLPPTRPMGYGNVTRALDLARRQLSAAGIANPTPEQLRAAMMGGTVSTANGDVTLQGVLRLRSQGMGWGQIAHVIGVHPGLRASTTGTTHSLQAPTTALSGSVPKNSLLASSRRASPGIVTGAGGAFSAGVGQTAAMGHGNAFGRGGKP
ncbi:MAG TPA: hypothetical protein VGP71_12525 [Burkholderiales bacterium]|nr:hypothetical protein [Burkholderiales bacterium]